MNLHKQKLLKDFEFLNLPTELIQKIESDDINIFESYILIKSFLDYITNKNKSI